MALRPGTEIDESASPRWWWVGVCMVMGFLLWMAPAAGGQTPCSSGSVIPASQEALRSECEALWAFYTTLDDPGILDDPDNPSAWLSTVPFSNWAGVVVVATMSAQ